MATASNAAVVQFPTPTGDWTQPDNIGIYDATTGGNLLIEQDISPDLAFAPGSGDNVQIAIGNLVVVLTAANPLTEAGATDMLEGLLTAGTRYIGLTSGTPPGTELTGNAYARVSVDAGTGWTFS